MESTFVEYVNLVGTLVLLPILKTLFDINRRLSRIEGRQEERDYGYAKHNRD